MSRDGAPVWVNYEGVKWYGPCEGQILLHGSVHCPRVWWNDVLKLWHYEESWLPMQTGSVVTYPTQPGSVPNALVPVLSLRHPPLALAVLRQAQL